ncbi:uncharacterized protein LOC116950529 isoform X2 [Petromyzon marinus]|uniref:uncharacterized protein LOC116950529 isoform X2 n=1 Tax=Petromyzon marinus TaxID=7757 RepID=UPI003F7183A2
MLCLPRRCCAWAGLQSPCLRAPCLGPGTSAVSQGVSSRWRAGPAPRAHMAPSWSTPTPTTPAAGAEAAMEVPASRRAPVQCAGRCGVPVPSRPALREPRLPALLGAAALPPGRQPGPPPEATSCVPCPPGSYSDSTSALPCREHTRCEDREMSTFINGTQEADAICKHQNNPMVLIGSCFFGVLVIVLTFLALFLYKRRDRCSCPIKREPNQGTADYEHPATEGRT